jgi:hypothetical protein
MAAAQDRKRSEGRATVGASSRPRCESRSPRKEEQALLFSPFPSLLWLWLLCCMLLVFNRQKGAWGLYLQTPMIPNILEEIPSWCILHCNGQVVICQEDLLELDHVRVTEVAVVHNLSCCIPAMNNWSSGCGHEQSLPSYPLLTRGRGERADRA